MNKITAAAIMVAVVASGCVGNGETPIGDSGGQPGDLAQEHDSGNVVDMTQAGPTDMVLNPLPMVPPGIPQADCTGFDSRIAVWGPATNGSFVRYSNVNNRLIARYEDSWNGNVDPHCYDVTPSGVSSNSVGGFSQGNYPYTYVLVFIGVNGANNGYVTRDGWTFKQLIN